MPDGSQCGEQFVTHEIAFSLAQACGDETCNKTNEGSRNRSRTLKV